MKDCKTLTRKFLGHYLKQFILAVKMMINTLTVQNYSLLGYSLWDTTNYAFVCVFLPCTHPLVEVNGFSLVLNTSNMTSENLKSDISLRFQFSVKFGEMEKKKD